ncbi:MAG: hypothetical protein D6794_10480 [Deltaproteobacteria bacterium]|nr:MAG: hypothetical protein D6794_10480 [Deltaproteobacteria bacterium]
MGTGLEVKVLPRVGHDEGREAQGREGDRASGGSVERTHGPTNRNRIRGAGDRGEWADDHEAPVTKGNRRKSGGGVGTVSVLIRGDLALGLKGPRGTSPHGARSQQRP